MAKNHNYYIYIVASNSGVLYLGVTNNILTRVEQHRSGLLRGFSQKYKTKRLLYYEYFTDIRDAIQREKEVKKWRREKKLALIKKRNPTLRDLSYTIRDGRKDFSLRSK